mgnify:FL=1
MKLKIFTISLLLAGAACVSCIREEALNTEADIESCTLAGDVLNRDPVIENEKVTLYLKKTAVLSDLAPEFTLTPGATISPASGTKLNFSSPQYYEVTSEDGQWKKQYKVEATTTYNIPTLFQFEKVRTTKTAKGEYQIFYETDNSGKETIVWASGNSGYALTGAGSGADTYPTYQSNIGYRNKCLALTTRKTGKYGADMNMPIAAGNLFLGTFEVLNALTNPLKATKFGIPTDAVPSRIQGYYKYKAGEKFYELDKSAPDKLKWIPDKTDIFNIYAVFYESTEDMKTLDGTNALAEDNPNILAVARITDAKETDEWTEFDLPFVFRPGKSVDPVKLDEGRYNLAIVFSSSIDGDRFSGAPGSTLCVDEVTMEYRDE